MAPLTIEKILVKIDSQWSFASEPEITLEANPTSVEQIKFKQFKDCGVNRLSLGMQALDDKDLNVLGRRHTVNEALRSYETADRVFDNISLDFMFGRQYQTLEEWEDELVQIIALNPNHLSIYQLTIEPETPFGKRLSAGKLPGLPEDDTLADMFQLTMETCASKGFIQYEISNYAKSGFEGRHNMVYWDYFNFLGIGPGAHGRINVKNKLYRTNTIRQPKQWLDNVLDLGTGENLRKCVDQKEQGAEYLLTALRLNRGMNLARFENMSGAKLNKQRVSELVKDGWVEILDGHIVVSNNGRMVLNQIITQLFP